MSESDKVAAERRDSLAREPELIVDPIKRAEAEAANGLRQFDLEKSIAQEAIDRQSSGDYQFRLRPSLILSLHRAALADVSSYAGNYRPSTVAISESRHTPPGAHMVAELVEGMCDYVNDNWPTATPIYLAAYVMWRLNWIHPSLLQNSMSATQFAFIRRCERPRLRPARAETA